MRKKTYITEQGELQEEKYCYSAIDPRPARTYYKPFQPSMIVPDRNMEISQIMSKYAGGQHRGLQPQYTDPEMMDMIQGIDARKLSICELHERINQNKQNIAQIQKNLQKQENARLQKEAEIAQQKYRDELSAEIQKELKETPKTH